MMMIVDDDDYDIFGENNQHGMLGDLSIMTMMIIIGMITLVMNDDVDDESSYYSK